MISGFLRGKIDCKSVTGKERLIMLTIEALRGLGADVEDGVRRCVNNEAFYLKMVDKAVALP